MSARTLIHVTHRNRLPSIFTLDNLLPSRAVGRKKVVWLADAKRLAWAMEHVAKSHRWPAEDLVVIKIRIEAGSLLRTGRPGVFNCPHAIPTAAFTFVSL